MTDQSIIDIAPATPAPAPLTEPASLPPPKFLAPAARPARSPRKWQSHDKQRGFVWADVKGYAYHPAGTPGNPLTSLYVYLAGGILRLTGSEAEQVWEELAQ